MSGGSYDYAYSRIGQLADEIKPTSDLRRAFIKHLHLVAQACHDIEWVDSGDYSEGREDEAIRECLGKSANALVLSECIEVAKKALSELQAAIKQAKGRK